MIGVDKHAGLCNGNRRHRWGKKEFLISRAVYLSRKGHICDNCDRVRITEFTKRGNHIAGYRNATVDELALNK